jgi:hypothetical protein
VKEAVGLCSSYIRKQGNFGVSSTCCVTSNFWFSHHLEQVIWWFIPAILIYRHMLHFLSTLLLASKETHHGALFNSGYLPVEKYWKS